MNVQAASSALKCIAQCRVSRFVARGHAAQLQRSSLSTMSTAPPGMSRQDAVRGFRKLLKTACVVFKDDNDAIEAARETLKEEFRKQAHVVDKKELEQMFAGIEEVEEMLRFNIVQGRMNERGNFDVDLSREETQAVLDSGKNLPQGVEFAPVDPSALGVAGMIKITKTSSKGPGAGGGAGSGHSH